MERCFTMMDRISELSFTGKEGIMLCQDFKLTTELVEKHQELIKISKVSLEEICEEKNDYSKSHRFLTNKSQNMDNSKVNDLFQNSKPQNHTSINKPNVILFLMILGF